VNARWGDGLPEEAAEACHVYASLAVPEHPRGLAPTFRLERWVGALRREIELRRDSGRWPLARACTIHAGGGSGKLLGPELATRLRKDVLGGMEPVEEFTIETESDGLDPRTLELWLGAGVTRVVLAPAAPGTVALAAGAFEAVGLSNWGVDMEFGGVLDPGEDYGLRKGGKERIDRILDLSPPSISLVESEPGGDPDTSADEYLEIATLLEGAGYEHWELTSFAKGDARSRHFEAVRRGEPYAGVGAGAHSFDGSRRFWNLEDPGAYITTVEAGRDPLEGQERLTRGQRALEWIWSGLRLAEGLPLASMPFASREVQFRWIEDGLAHPDPERLRLTRRGWLLLDGLAVDLASTCPVDVGFPEVRSSDTP
jgi:oxygen-independent coproporphyrinogen III oxidase